MARHVVNVVVGDVVFAALPHHYAHRVPVDQPAMVDVVVEDFVLLVDVFRAGPVSDQHDAALPHVADLIAFDAVFLGI